MTKVWAVLGRLVAAIFGNLQWQAPPWARFVGGKASGSASWARAHKGASAGIMAAVAALGAGGYFGWQWWESRPKPVETHVSISAPEATRVEEHPRINPALVEFDGSVAPLKSVGKLITSGVEISPKIEGTWKWESDRVLAFQPKADWPIGQEYTVKLAKKDLVPPHVTLSTYKLTFATAPFTARIAEAEFHQDPVDANLKKVVATVAFSHPVDPQQLEKRIKLRFIPTNKEEKEADYKFHVSYDRFKVHAYVHSSPVTVPQKDAHMRVTLEPGVTAARGGPAHDEKLEQQVTIPGLYNFLKVSGARLTVVDNEKNEPEQVLVVETSAAVHEDEMKKAISAWVLPVYENPDEAKSKRAHRWDNPEMVGPEHLKKGAPLKLEMIAGEREYSTQHSFRLRADVGRFIYVRVNKGLRAFGGYVLGESFDATDRVGEFPRQLRLLHSGALMALSGDKKVTVFARDVPGLRVEIGRVLPEQLHHLFTQSGGPFAHPNFNYNFSEENLAEFIVETRDLRAAERGKPVYEAIDLGKHLKERGVFLLRVQSWDPERKHTLGEDDRRLILVSDLGVIVKDAVDGTHDVFAQSIHTGEPVSGAKIEVIGKNGVAVHTSVTDGEGHAKLPDFRDLRREKSPVAYLISKGRDTSFLPLSRGDRALDTSRFDVGGVSEPPNPKSLTAFVFSDRGLYRPGDEMRFGMIVRSRDWQGALEGVPLQAVLTDARGVVVRKDSLKLGKTGFEELRHTTAEVSPTGSWTLSVYVVKDGRQSNLLGSTTVSVREFMPDRMKVSVHLSTENPEGWVHPGNLKGRVTLQNLFGTPATKRRVRAELSLTPGLPHFSKWKDYRFIDPLKAKDSFHDTLSDGETDDEGGAEFDLALNRFASATYRLRLIAEGYEAEGGRGVAGDVSATVSPLQYLIGYKPDGDLHWLSKGSKHEVDLIAVGPRGDKVEAKGLRSTLYERKWLSVLVRQPNGTYKYDSVRREIASATKTLNLSAQSTKLALPTENPGDFALLIKNDKDEELQRIEFSVAGTANLTRSMDKNAELQIQLAKKDLEPGQEVELSIKAPYVGAGLITVERERVFAWRWFKTSTTAAVEKIKIPEDLEGDGYLSVAFVRDPGSDEVFTSPLSYGVVPFSINRARRKVQVTVASADLVKPGTPYKMKLTADRPTRAVVFAVDEGILRVADYSTPDPLAHFFRKRALGVRTSQILDLILPEYKRLMSALAPGGDGEAAIGAHLNPFKRKRDKPVAWWSGIVEIGPKGRDLSYDIPDYFNGTLRVMAVAVSEDAVGSVEKKTIVRGDFVLSPNVPAVVAPGDEFEVSVGVANNVVGSGKGAPVEVTLKTGAGLQVVGADKATLNIDEMREGSTKFKLRANDVLGSASLTFLASHKNSSGKLATDLSVRPATPYLVSFQAGHLKEGSTTVKVERALYAEHRKLQAGISHLPLGLTHGLASYLEKYPHGCTEQVTSQLVPALVLGGKPEFAISAESSSSTVKAAIETLRQRQNEEGAFGQWAANPHVVPLASVYALHILVEAKERGFPVSDLLKAGQPWLQQIARRDGDNLAEERVRAYALYVLTRTGMQTGGMASAFEKHVNANHPKEWKGDLAGAYLAATYQLLKQDGKAKALVENQKLAVARTPDFAVYYDSLAHDAQLLYLLARHFPERAAKVTPAELNGMVEPIFRGTYNTFSSAHTILALEAYGRAAATQPEGALIAREIVDKSQRPLALPKNLLPIADFSDKASAIEFQSEGSFGAYWLVNQRGFDRGLPQKELKQKLEIFRELTDVNGKPVEQVKLGEELQVRLKVRALDKPIADLVIVDLLPGGFEVVVQAAKEEEGTHEEYSGEENEGGGEGEEGGEPEGDVEGAGDDTGPGVGETAAAGFPLPIAVEQTLYVEYGDVREDRVVLFGSADQDAKTFVYAIKATNVGTYVVPPVQAESMYDRSVIARGRAGKITVIPR